ncbi:unnamed protein product, partial [Gulo gulo]
RSAEGGAPGGRGRAGRAPAPGGRGGGRVFPGAFPARPSDSLSQETPRACLGPRSRRRPRPSIISVTEANRIVVENIPCVNM